MRRILNLAVAVSAASLTAGILAAPAQAATPAAPTARQALLVGELGYEGGAYPPAFHPTAGTVEVVFTKVPIALLKKVGRSGQFKIPLPPGRYSVTGCGPTSSGGTAQCSQPATISLRAGEVDFIELVWAYAP